VRHRFFSVGIDIPDGWTNRSLAAFVSPPADGPQDLPTLAKRKSLAAMSITVAPAIAAPHPDGATSLRKRLAAIRAQTRDFTPGPVEVMELAGRRLTFSVCPFATSDGIPVRQIVASIEQGDILVEATASAPSAGFDSVREQLLSILGTIEVEIDTRSG
jgi:hypothetical protein